MRASLPVRHFTGLRNAGRCSWTCRALPGLPLRGITTVRTPSSCRSLSPAASPYPRSAVTVRGRRVVVGEAPIW